MGNPDPRAMLPGFVASANREPLNLGHEAEARSTSHAASRQGMSYPRSHVLKPPDRMTFWTRTNSVCS